MIKKGLEIRDMTVADEYYVGTCSHTNESKTLDNYASKRIAWLREKHRDGLRVKVALIDGKQRGLLYVMPIERSPVEPLGQDLMVIPCLFASFQPSGLGIGRALLEAAEKECLRQRKMGLTTIAYYSDFWFMPAGFFEKCGFKLVERREERAIMWKVLAGEPLKPTFFKADVRFKPVTGKIVLDHFWMTFCGALDRDVVREVAGEFADDVIVREHCVDDRKELLKYQLNRCLYINGKKVDWDFADPKPAIRSAIKKEKDLIYEKLAGDM